MGCTVTEIPIRRRGAARCTGTVCGEVLRVIDLTGGIMKQPKNIKKINNIINRIVASHPRAVEVGAEAVCVRVYDDLSADGVICTRDEVLRATSPRRRSRRTSTGPEWVPVDHGEAVLSRLRAICDGVVERLGARWIGTSEVDANRDTAMVCGALSVTSSGIQILVRVYMDCKTYRRR